MADATPEVVEQTYRWRFMGNHPLTGALRHIGSIDRLPVYVGDQLVREGQLVPAPGEEPYDAITRAEPSKIIGVNITEAEYLAGEHLRGVRSEVVATAPVEAPAKGAKAD